MSELLQRIAQIVRSYVSSSLDSPPEPRNQRNQGEEEAYTRHSAGRKKPSQKDQDTASSQSSRNPFPGVAQHVIDDLAVFGLTPPSSLDRVRTARNKEVKKYHSDKFINDPDRFETSKEIMQIYNAAFDRLRVYYEKP